MSVKSLNHIGIAVHSIDAQKPFYEDSLGLEFEGLEDVPSQKVRVAFFRGGYTNRIAGAERPREHGRKVP